MNQTELSNRLQRVGANIPLNARLADIGSDHAYLPVALLLKGHISFAVAGEVVDGPYQSALQQVRKNQLSEDKIKVRLADGLAAIKAEDHIDVITIAGMGGTLIRSILEAGKVNQQLKGTERLILQPNVGEQTLRAWLQMNGYTILHEEIVEENKKIYEIIVAEIKEPINYNEKELFFGPILLENQGLVFEKKWRHELQARQNVLVELGKAEEKPQEKINDIQKQIFWIKEVLQ